MLCTYIIVQIRNTKEICLNFQTSTDPNLPIKLLYTNNSILNNIK